MSRRERKQQQKDSKRDKVKTLMRQAEEGVLVYTKQSIFGLQFRSNGYGGFYELGRMKSTRKTMTYHRPYRDQKCKGRKITQQQRCFG